ncbi:MULTISPECIES: hypothetical protein [unclassified Polaribacter]|jgi:hypothetical protein|uniref:hypothetical protein n=1 Tax=unclassified Polaribacter TaxID=196858 RepID=UPI001C4F6A81|nr:MULTISPECIES: hypothetical protein [unclassified Polaribacter]QXP62032.1 hypothetical protein H0I27_08995 [Polaribacter sp. HaHaR_3_91]QXP67784.1 hypothetical protein H0I28_04575 [Polaribacter sp. AHE13PA]QXP69947.1 hypothetical protein H0I29_15190 [Polaribacter sp. R2A056_3_33]
MSVIKHERGLHPLKGTVKTDEKNEKDSDNKKESIVAEIDKKKEKDELKNQIQSATDDADEIAGKIKSSEKE